MTDLPASKHLFNHQLAIGPDPHAKGSRMPAQISGMPQSGLQAGDQRPVFRLVIRDVIAKIQPGYLTEPFTVP